MALDRNDLQGESRCRRTIQNVAVGCRSPLPLLFILLRALPPCKSAKATPKTPAKGPRRPPLPEKAPQGIGEVFKFPELALYFLSFPRYLGNEAEKLPGHRTETGTGNQFRVPLPQGGLRGANRLSCA